MNITETTVTRLVIDGVPNLALVAVYLEDCGPKRGKVTITCDNGSWSHFWGAMGNTHTIRSFFLSCDTSYLIGKFAPGLESEETDLGDIVGEARREIVLRRRWEHLSKALAREYWDEAVELADADDVRELGDRHGGLLYRIFGDEWWYRLPTQPNQRYVQLARILDTVKKALRMQAAHKTQETGQQQTAASNTCAQCGYDWDAHEFGVPAPFCPSDDAAAERNRVGSEHIKQLLNGTRVCGEHG